MTQIASSMNCSTNKVVYWMRKHKIPRRSFKESVYLMHNPSGDPFRIKQKLTNEEAILFGLGLGIYWGEGNKVNKLALRVANTDPYLIKSFIFFMKKICNLEDRRFSFSIICFNDTEPDLARKYWSSTLNIEPERFGKITQIPTQGKGTYKKKSLFGVCTVQANNVKLRAWLFDQLELFKQSLPK